MNLIFTRKFFMTLYLSLFFHDPLLYRFLMFLSSRDFISKTSSLSHLSLITSMENKKVHIIKQCSVYKVLNGFDKMSEKKY